ncbi:MAG: DsbC family protein [Sulfuritalea sp.]|nr:DsbC family protein [Sulfuritalea sp.]
MLKPIIATLTLVLFAATSNAADTDDVLTRLKTQYPATQFDSVVRSELANIYEIRMGNNIAYTDAAGKLWIFGHLYDMAQSRDLTAERLKGKSPQDAAGMSGGDTKPSLNALRPKDAIVRVKGKGTRKLILFSDVECPYCARLEKELSTLDDVTIYTYPVAFVSDGYRAESVWCSENRAEAWDRAMRGEEVLRHASVCLSPLSRNTKIAMDLGVRGTPTMMQMDGTRLAGYSSASRIEAWLAR